MSDDRPAEDVVEAIARISKELEDFKTTTAARLLRRPTGDIEPTIRKVAKADTLLLQGQAVDRATYAALWKWAQESSLVSGGLFGPGNGTTTFTLPDFRGRVPIGVGTQGADTYTLGQVVGTARVTLGSTNLPSHTHPVSGNTDTEPDHTHNFSTNTTGSHGEHMGQRLSAAAGGGTLNLINTQISGGSHSHSGTTAGGGPHNHSFNVTSGATGSSTPFDARQPSIAVNWLIWV